MTDKITEIGQIPSLWDGWEKQCYFRLRDHTGATCAMGFIYKGGNVGEEDEKLERIGIYLRQHYSIPNERTVYPHWTAITYANNWLRLTPEQFREIDRLSKIEAVVKPLVDSVEQELILSTK